MVDLVLFLILVSAYQDGQVVNVKEVSIEQTYACTHMQPQHSRKHTHIHIQCCTYVHLHHVDGVEYTVRQVYVHR